MSAPVVLTTLQHEILLAISRGESYTMWPMMRMALRRWGLIRAVGAAPPPTEQRRVKQPTRRYELTPAGIAALAAYTGPTPPHHEVFPRLTFERPAK